MANKAPFNYIGNKYRIIDDIEQYFPQNINTFVDLLCGGCDVTINTRANHKIANDINFFVINIFQWIKDHTIEEVLDYIQDKIDEYHLSKTNQDGFLALRHDYNALPPRERHPMDLYVLMCFGFNYQFRFNSDLKFNNPFGKDRSCFTGRMRDNLIQFHALIQNTDFTAEDYRNIEFAHLGENDFVYADPPYLLTCGSYNDGKRGFNGWKQDDDQQLMFILDELNERGIRFAMSNVIEHKGNRNIGLENWVEGNAYHIHNIDFNYNNSNYHSRNRENRTQEVLITNY